MIKKIFLLIILLLSITGCKKEDNNKLYLTNKYYNNGSFIDIQSKDINNMKNETYILYTYNNYCTFSKPCEDIFKEVMEKEKIDFLSIPFEEFRNTYLYDTVKYAPSIIIVNNAKIVAYLDANSDEDLNKYQDTLVFKEWLNTYINFK